MIQTPCREISPPPPATLEDQIRQNLPALRDRLIDILAANAARKFLLRRSGGDSICVDKVGRRVVQTPGPGQTC
jgi:hypothetical protein